MALTLNHSKWCVCVCSIENSAVINHETGGLAKSGEKTLNCKHMKLKIIWANTTAETFCLHASLKCHLTVRCVRCSLQKMFDGCVYDLMTRCPIQQHEAWSDSWELRSAWGSPSTVLALSVLHYAPSSISLQTLQSVTLSHHTVTLLRPPPPPDVHAYV